MQLSILKTALGFRGSSQLFESLTTKNPVQAKDRIQQSCLKDSIDFVIAWVDGADPSWLRQKRSYEKACDSFSDNRDQRYRDWGTLKYWFRGVERFAPWVRKVHFVTAGHIPPWLNANNEKINIVKHTDFIPDVYLPTFNSHTIELNLHRIEGLCERFVYFNDDMFLVRPTCGSDFFKGGLPCDSFGLAIIPFGSTTIGTINSFNMTVINDHFDKHEQFRINKKKWLSFENGFGNVSATLRLMKWKWFPGFYSGHLPNSFLKTTFFDVWKIEQQILDYSCRCRFRRQDNVNQWLMRYWQLASGAFWPRKPTIGYAFFGDAEYLSEAAKKIQFGRHSIVCINDGAQVNDFEYYRSVVCNSFEHILPEKSSFER